MLQRGVAAHTVTAATHLVGVGSHAGRVLGRRSEVARRVHLLEDVDHAVLSLLLRFFPLTFILGQAALFVLLFKFLMLQEVLRHNTRDFSKVLEHLLTRIDRTAVNTLAQLFAHGRVPRRQSASRLLLQEAIRSAASRQEPAISVVFIERLLGSGPAKTLDKRTYKMS